MSATPDATAKELAASTGGSYQSVQQAQTRIRRKARRYAEAQGMTVDDVYKAAAKISDKSKPIETSGTKGQLGDADLAETGSMGVVSSPGQSQIDISATTKGKVVMDSLTGKPVKDNRHLHGAERSTGLNSSTTCG